MSLYDLFEHTQLVIVPMVDYIPAPASPDKWDFWFFAKTFGPSLIAAGIAGMALTVALTQRTIAANKYKLDMFDKRYDLFSNFYELYELILIKNDMPFLDDDKFQKIIESKSKLYKITKLFKFICEDDIDKLISNMYNMRNIKKLISDRKILLNKSIKIIKNKREIKKDIEYYENIIKNGGEYIPEKKIENKEDEIEDDDEESEYYDESEWYNNFLPDDQSHDDFYDPISPDEYNYMVKMESYDLLDQKEYDLKNNNNEFHNIKNKFKNKNKEIILNYNNLTNSLKFIYKTMNEQLEIPHDPYISIFKR